MKRIIVLFALLLTLTIAAAAAETLVLPEDTKVIETEAFFNTGAETIILPAGVTSIGDRAFGGSGTLRKVYVPDSLLSRAGAALEGSENAEFVPLSSLWSDLFTWQAVNNASVTIQKYIGTLTELTIPAEIDGLPVTEIGYQAFKGNTSLTKVVIPEGVETLQNEAFHSCASLTDVTFPSTLTKIGNNAFSGCGSDAQEPFYFRLPDGLTEVGRLISDNQMAFYNCNAVKIVTPDSATARLLSQKNAEMCWFTFPGEEDFRYLYSQSQSGGEYDTLYLKKYAGTNPEVNIPDHGTAYTRISVIDSGSFTTRGSDKGRDPGGGCNHPGVRVPGLPPPDGHYFPLHPHMAWIQRVHPVRTGRGGTLLLLSSRSPDRDGQNGLQHGICLRDMQCHQGCKSRQRNGVRAVLAGPHRMVFPPREAGL